MKKSCATHDETEAIVGRRTKIEYFGKKKARGENTFMARLLMYHAYLCFVESAVSLVCAVRKAVATTCSSRRDGLWLATLALWPPCANTN